MRLRKGGSRSVKTAAAPQVSARYHGGAEHCRGGYAPAADGVV